KRHIFSRRVNGVASCDGSLYIYAGVHSKAGSGNGALVERLDWRNNRVTSRTIVADFYPGMQGITCAGSGRVLIDGSTPGQPNAKTSRAVLVTVDGPQPIEGDLGSDAIGGLSVAQNVGAIA